MPPPGHAVHGTAVVWSRAATRQGKARQTASTAISGRRPPTSGVIRPRSLTLSPATARTSVRCCTAASPVAWSGTCFPPGRHMGGISQTASFAAVVAPKAACKARHEIFRSKNIVVQQIRIVTVVHRTSCTVPVAPHGIRRLGMLFFCAGVLTGQPEDASLLRVV